VGGPQDPFTPSLPGKDGHACPGIPPSTQPGPPLLRSPQRCTPARTRRRRSPGKGLLPLSIEGAPPAPLVPESQGKGTDGEGLSPPERVKGEEKQGASPPPRQRQSEVLEPRDEGEDAIRGGAGVCALEQGRGEEEEEEERWVMTKAIEHFLARLPPSILAVGPARS